LLKLQFAAGSACGVVSVDVVGQVFVESGVHAVWLSGVVCADCVGAALLESLLLSVWAAAFVSDELFFCEELALPLPSVVDWFGKGSSTGVLLGVKNEPLFFRSRIVFSCIGLAALSGIVSRT
jgi:hypothetical protein